MASDPMEETPQEFPETTSSGSAESL